MKVLEFQVFRHHRKARWTVRLGNSTYGMYLDKEQALLDAVEAAQEALESGCEAQVWLRDVATTARVL